MNIFFLQLAKKVNQLLGKSDRSVGTTSQRSQKLFLKTYSSFLRDIDTQYLENEGLILQQLAGKKVEGVIAPEVVHFTHHDYHVELTTTLHKGSLLESTSKAEILTTLHQIFLFLENDEVRWCQPALGTRSVFTLFTSGITSFIRALLRQPNRFFSLLSVGVEFIWLMLPVLLQKQTYVLTHRDLDPHNILKLENGVTLLCDWENAVQSVPLYDLAQIPRLYARLLTPEVSLEFVTKQLRRTQDERTWRAFALHGVLSSLANDAKDSHMYTDCWNILPHVRLPKKSLYEIIHFWTFSILALLQKVIPSLFPIARGGFILCYHSVGYDQWRYTTPPFELQAHLTFLQKESSLKTVSQVLASHQGTAITFDDGYKNLAEHGRKFFSSIPAKPLVFLLGTPENANREQLDNTLPLLTKIDIKSLTNAGWEWGFHTQTHGNIAKMNESELKQEIAQGKKHLEQSLGRELPYFAYPRGAYSSRIRSQVETAHFSAAFLVDGGVVANSESAMQINRIPMERGISPEQLRVQLSPIGLWITALFLRILTVKESIISGTWKTL